MPGDKLPGDLPAYLRATVAPELPDLLRPAFLDALDRPEAIRSMQVGGPGEDESRLPAEDVEVARWRTNMDWAYDFDSLATRLPGLARPPAPVWHSPAHPPSRHPLPAPHLLRTS